MNNDSQQLHGIVKDLRNTNLTVEESIERVFNRLQDVGVVTEKERNHVERLFMDKVEKECEERLEREKGNE